MLKTIDLLTDWARPEPLRGRRRDESAPPYGQASAPDARAAQAPTRLVRSEASPCPPRAQTDQSRLLVSASSTPEAIPRRAPHSLAFRRLPMFLARLTWATALAGLLAAPALAAASDSDEIIITGNQDKSCVITLQSGVDSQIVLNLDPDGDAKLNAPITGSFTYGDSYCNSAHFVILSTTPMTQQLGPISPASPHGSSDPFKNNIHFTATLTNWSGASPTANTAGASSAVAPVGHAFRNDADPTTTNNPNPGLTLAIATETSGIPLLRGTYSGSATVTLQSQ